MGDNSGQNIISLAFPNKYMMACAISKRARQLSEKKGRLSIEEGYSNPISVAMKEIEEGKILLVNKGGNVSPPLEGEVVFNDTEVENKP